jgi:hypothetical protein
MDHTDRGLAPFSIIPLALSAHFWTVKIENTAGRNFKDLGEMMGNAKSLKRTNRECKAILIGPSMAPHFCGAEIPLLFFRSIKSGIGFRSNLAARMASRRPH